MKTVDGLISYVEADEGGEIMDMAGEENEELGTIANSFVELGTMIGEAMNLGQFEQILVIGKSKNSCFVRKGESHFGVEYRGN